MTWCGPALDQDQLDVVGLVEDVLDGVLPEQPQAADGDLARRGLAGAGVWSVGMPEECGGGGASEPTVGLVVSGLAQRSGGFGWAFTQAHAACHVLHRDPRWAGQAAGVASGALGVAVVDSAQPGVLWDPTTNDVLRLSGLRVDVLGTLDLLVVLRGDREVLVVSSEDLVTTATPTTGLQECATLSVRAELPLRPEQMSPTGESADAFWRTLAIGTLAGAAGLVASASQHAEGYARGRIQFGKPLTALASMRQMLETQHALAYELAAKVLTSADIGTAELVAMAARAVAESVDACADAVQAHGGYGYLEEYPVEKLLRDAVSLHAASPVTRRAAAEGADRLLGAAR